MNGFLRFLLHNLNTEWKACYWRCMGYWLWEASMPAVSHFSVRVCSPSSRGPSNSITVRATQSSMPLHHSNSVWQAPGNGKLTGLLFIFLLDMQGHKHTRTHTHHGTFLWVSKISSIPVRLVNSLGKWMGQWWHSCLKQACTRGESHSVS